MAIKFDYNLLKNKTNEMDVNSAYRTLFSRLFTKYGLTSPYNCDGYLTVDEPWNIDALCEFKDNLNLTNKLDQIKILIQTVYYLKKFEKDGKKLPKVIFVGDTDECFVMHTNSLTKYLDYGVDWSIAPSSAYSRNPEMLKDILEDVLINPFVFQLHDGFIWEAIRRKLSDLSTNVTRLIKINDSNIVQVFERFCTSVLHKSVKLNAHDKASLFISRLINDTDMYLHPKKKGALITKDFGEIKVNEDSYINFFNHFDGKQYSIKQKQELVRIVDRIVEDEGRRRSGDYFTPTIWVDEAHKMISEQFGEDWKEKYVVWDCAWGTGNLTRDYQFKELYASTLFKSEIDVANSNRVNMDATKFQYDFLNDGIVDGKIDVENDDKLPQGLKDAILSGKEIIFFINPPYGRASSGHDGNDIKRTGISINKINDMMIKEKLGQSSSQLYTQFLYKITKLKQFNNNINICVFSKSLYKTGGSFKKFRNLFYSNFKYNSGMLFSAKHFDGTSDSWGVDFSIWSDGLQLDRKTDIIIKDLDENLNIKDIFIKSIYSTDNFYECSKWVRKDVKRIKTYDCPQLSSAIILKNKGKSKLVDDSLGYLYSDSNNVMKNSQSVGIFTSGFSHSQGLSIIKENIFKCVSLFTARKTITGKYANWINDKDEYIAPTPEVEESEKFKQFQYDSIVYSLFNTSSNQSSMRQIDYKDKKWDIKNEFFWMSKEEMMDMADKNGFDDIYYDAEHDKDRYVYDLLFNQGVYEKLSPDAKEVLDLATDLVRKSFHLRQPIHIQKPEWHLNTWDAGFYQLKLYVEEYFEDDFKNFKKKYKEFEDRLRPQVYELGFLK